MNRKFLKINLKLTLIIISLIGVYSNRKKLQYSVQVFGRKKTATAVAFCKRGHGLIHVNGRPLDNLQPAVMRYKLLEPILLLGQDK